MSEIKKIPRITQETKYTKILHKKIKKLNLEDRFEIGGLIVCLYANGCPEADCAELFNLSTEQIIEYLKTEEIYGYKICKDCQKLKNRVIDFNHYKNKEFLICRDCDSKQHAIYYKIHQESLRKTQKQYRDNKGPRTEYNKQCYIENKEKRTEYNKQYYQDNQEKLQETNTLNKQKPATEYMVQRLRLYEKTDGNKIACKYCGNMFVPTTLQVQNRIDGINIHGGRNQIYCCNECKLACPIYNQKKYPKGFKKASSTEVLNPFVRQEAFKRDEYTCQMCGLTQEELNIPLHAHHIVPKSSSPIESQDVSNIITLCKDCHIIVHETPGCTYQELGCESTVIKYKEQLSSEQIKYENQIAQIMLEHQIEQIDKE